MTDRYQTRLDADRAMRDAARGLVEQDVAFLRGDNARRSVPARMSDRARGAAGNAAEKASGIASDNRGAVGAAAAVGLAALALFLFRKPLIALLAEWIGWDQRSEPEDRSLVEILKAWILGKFGSEPEG